MPDTITPVLVGADQYRSVSTLTGGSVAVGAACTLQNRGNYAIDFIVRATQPLDTERGEVLPADVRVQGSVASGENEIWLKSEKFSSLVSIQGA